MSTLWRRRQEQLPEGSANRRQGQRRSPESQRPGAAEEAPAELGAEGGRASPRILRATRAPPKAGATRPLPQSWGRQKSPGNGDKRHGTGETRARGPPRTWKPLDAVQPPPPAVAGSAASTHRPPPPPAGPQRARTSSSDPTPQPPVRSAEWGALGSSFVSWVPTTSQQHCRGNLSARVVPSPIRGHPEARRRSERAASGLLSKSVSRGQLFAERGSSLGNPELIAGDRGGQVQALSPRMPCRCGRVRILREVQRNGESKDLPAGRQASARARKAAGGRVGGALGAPGRGGSGESSLRSARAGARGGSSPGAAGPGPGVCKKPWSEAGAQRPGRGRPFWAGSRLGAEGGAEVV